MAAKGFEHEDPMELVGYTYPIDSQVEHDGAAALTFIEEFALMGWPPSRIRGLFESKMYSACFDIRQRRGDAFVDELIAQVFGVSTDA